MSKLNKIGKTILRKERVLDYKNKRDFISKLEQKKTTLNEDKKVLLHWYIKGDEMLDIIEFKEFLISSEYKINFFKYDNREDEIQCTLEISIAELNKDYYYRLLGFLVYHGKYFFCEIFGINRISINSVKEWEMIE